MRVTQLVTLVGLTFLDLAFARFEPHHARVLRAKSAPGGGTLGHFDQLIDHQNPSLGTFKQRFWWNDQFYAGPGSPIVLESPSESDVDPDYIDLTNGSLTGLFAQTNKAAGLIIEHRYWGDSSPVGFNFTAENLQHLTLDNAIQDLIYFAHNVHLPFDRKGQSKPDKAPWILTGCSYAGALSAWTHALAPGTFWAHECGSAVVETVSSFWEYFTPIEAALPRNCSADWKRIVTHIDTVIRNGSVHQKAQLKEYLSQPNTTDAEFGENLTIWLGEWQDQQLTTGYSHFFVTCDYIENQWPGSKAPSPGPDGVGLKLALQGFARLQKKEFLEKKKSGHTTQGDKPWSLPDDVLWNWFLCNEPFEWWQVWAPEDSNGLVIQAYNRSTAIQESCVDAFPEVDHFRYGLANGKTIDQVNTKTGGWNNVNTTRLVWVNGEFDPWRPATVSWDRRPGGALKSTPNAPVHVIPGAAHCNDYYPSNANGSDAAKKIFDDVVSQMQEWVAEFYAQNGEGNQTG